MLIVGIILLVLGLIVPALKVLFWLGLLLALVGAVFLALHSTGRSERNWY